MNMEDKINALARHNGTLMRPEELSGLFLPIGIPPRDDVMLLAEMPSMNKSKECDNQGACNFSATKRDEYFRDMIVKHGLSGVYVTDIVKQRADPGQPTCIQIKNWLDFLLKEMEILKPRYIIVIGRRTYEKSFLPYVHPKLNQDIIHNFIFHYSQGSHNKFEKRLGEIVQKYSLRRQ